MMNRPRFLPDNFVLALLAAIVLATVLPISGTPAAIYHHVTLAAIALLFFLHGAKLSGTAMVAGASNWPLHLCVLAATFLLFPLIGIAAKPLLTLILPAELYTGLLFLCLLPSTVQSSIVFTSIAGGNVSAAICSASLSNLLGVIVTPLLAGLLIASDGQAGVSLSAVGHIMLEIVAPFAAGQFMRRWIGAWVAVHPRLVKFVDQGSIVLVVYGAFSASVVAGLWHQIPPAALLTLLAVDAVLLALILLITFGVGRRLFDRQDAIVLLFCGSKKSLASGIPIAKVLFASSTLGAVVLPLMLFHQLQLIVCAAIARRYARHGVAGATAPGR